MAGLARFVTGRRTKWWVIGLWIVGALIMSVPGSKLGDVSSDNFASFLPKNTESTKVQNLLRERFPGGETGSGLIVYRRPGGLTAQDKARIAQDAQAVAKKIPVVAPPPAPFTSPNGEVAYTVLTVPSDFQKASDWGEDARTIVHASTPSGLQVYVTGDIGVSADFQKVFGNIDVKLLGVTVLLVLVLLGAIYRSPLIALIPIVVVGFSTFIANGLIYLYAKATGDVSRNATTILIVLMFGVGTDYCLLLVSRYREELHTIQDKHQAMERALRRAGPALLASGSTVICAMLVLLLAEVGSTRGLGPVCAIGVACVLLAGLTLLPALLTIAGRTGFWPMRHTVECRPTEDLAANRGPWRRFGDRVLHRPGVALISTVALFAVFTLGLTTYKEDYSVDSFFKSQTESVDGFNVLSAAFPAGALAPMIAITQPDKAQEVTDKVKGVKGVAAVSRPLPSKDGKLVQLSVIVADDPYSDAALKRVHTIRDALDGTGALLGAGSALQEDFNAAAERDLKVIVPAALLVITIILGILLQAIVAPLVLIATVMASFFGTLGLSLWFFTQVLGDKGVDASLPTYAFIFLVALGVDYTIFLMSRVREEARTFGTREGTLRAIAATGPVITSAGIILAGTFAVLMTLPVTFVFNIGFMVSVGILLDTFIVRTVMVPAAVELLGDRVWWPSTAQGGGRALREHVEPEQTVSV
jgi:putative drug exporter of the RND superfamily